MRAAVDFCMWALVVFGCVLASLAGAFAAAGDFAMGISLIVAALVCALSAGFVDSWRDWS